MAVLCFVVAGVVVAYWAAWFAHRSLVAVEATPVYVGFEQAFPLADAWLVVCLVAGGVALLARSSWALLFLLAGCGAGLYLWAMDLLYDVEHGIWGKGANGLVELAINVATLVLSLGVARWTWRRRDALAPR